MKQNGLRQCHVILYTEIRIFVAKTGWSLDHRETPQTSPIRPHCLDFWLLSIFFFVRMPFLPVLPFSLSGKLLHSLEEPSAYIVSSIETLSSPLERDRHLSSVLPWSLCLVAAEAKIYFLLFPTFDNGGMSV